MANKRILFLVGFAVLGTFLGITLARIKVKNSKSIQNIKVIEKTLPSTNSSANSEVKLMFLGDVMLGRSVMLTSESKNDLNYPFEKSVERLKKVDLVFVNLENAVTSNCPSADSSFKLCSKPEMLAGLNFANIGIVNIANNHTGDFGPEGLKETMANLDKYGVSYTGNGNLVIKEIKGVKIGFLGFNYVFKNAPESDYQLIKDSKSKVDILIVAVHWGIEYTKDPTSEQQAVAKRLVESGADMIIGGHPHWVQKEENIDSKPVYFSLGNFVFDQMWSEETKKGMAIEATVKEGKIFDVKSVNTYMSSFAQPEFLNN